MKKNDDLTVQLAEKINGGTNLEIFGLQDLGNIPSGVRRRIRAGLENNIPLAQQAWRLLAENKPEDAEVVFLQCVQEGERSDDRFFSVYWGLAQIAMKREQWQTAASYGREAIIAFPHKAREEHFVHLVNVILRIDPRAESDAAAVAFFGLQALGIDPTELRQNARGNKLLDAYVTLEQKRTNEVRPKTIEEILNRYARPINIVPIRMKENRSVQAG